MPAKTPRQQRFMALCANAPAKARGKCPPKGVAREYAHKPRAGYRKKGRRGR
jgi:hypothetical protein